MAGDGACVGPVWGSGAMAGRRLIRPGETTIDPLTNEGGAKWRTMW